MTLRHFFFSVLLLCAAFPSLGVASTIPAGLQSTLWFSRDPLVVGEKVTVYAMVYNSGTFALSGEVALLHGTTTFATQSFNVAGGGGSQVIGFPFVVTPGAHTFSARLTNLALLSTDSSLATIDPIVTSPVSGAEKRIAATQSTSSSSPSRVDVIAKAPAQVLTEAKDLATTTAAKVIDRVYEKVPAPVTATLPVIGAIETYRRDQADSATTKLNALKVEMTAVSKGAQPQMASTSASEDDAPVLVARTVSKGEITDIFTTPFHYIELFALLVWEYIFSHPWLFYGLILYVFYRIIRAILGVIF